MTTKIVKSAVDEGCLIAIEHAITCVELFNVERALKMMRDYRGRMLKRLASEDAMTCPKCPIIRKNGELCEHQQEAIETRGEL